MGVVVVTVTPCQSQLSVGLCYIYFFMFRDMNAVGRLPGRCKAAAAGR